MIDINKINKYTDEKFIIFLKKKQNKINLNLLDEYGNTMLHLFCRKRKYKIIKYLLDNGADPKIKNYDGRVPLHFATIYGSGREISSILNLGFIDVKNIMENSKKIIDILLLSCPESMFITDNFGYTPLNYYEMHSQIKDIKLIKDLCKLLGCTTKNMEKIETYLLLKKNKLT